MTSFSIFVHNLFTVCPYSISVLDRKGAATRPTEYFYTPSSSNPSIRKSLGYRTGAFPIIRVRRFLRFCKLKATVNHNSRYALFLFCQKRSAGLCFCDFSQKYANPKNEFLQWNTCILRFIVVK